MNGPRPTVNDMRAHREATGLGLDQSKLILNRRWKQEQLERLRKDVNVFNTAETLRDLMDVMLEDLK